MTDEQLDALEQKWSREFGGQEVSELIEEVRRLRESHEAYDEMARRFLRDYPVVSLHPQDEAPSWNSLPCRECEKDGLAACQHNFGKDTLQVIVDGG